jgi:hypothetical protein
MKPTSLRVPASARLLRAVSLAQSSDSVNESLPEQYLTPALVKADLNYYLLKAGPYFSGRPT